MNTTQRRGCLARVEGFQGFTLIELMITIVIVGSLATLGIANFMSIQERARYSSCVSNQRHMLESTLLYISEQDPGTTNFNANFLTASGYLSAEVCECPSSNLDDFDDYTIQIASNKPTSIQCSIKPTDHAWALP